MAHFSIDDKLHVLYEYSPLINGVNPPTDLSNIPQLLMSVEQTYGRSIKKLGLQNVATILNYLIQNGAFDGPGGAIKLLGKVTKDLLPDRAGSTNDEWYVPVEIQVPFLAKLLDIVQNASLQWLRENSSDEAKSCSPAEAFDKIVSTRKDEKDELLASGARVSRPWMIHQEESRMKRVRDNVLKGELSAPVILEKSCLSAQSFTESLGDTSYHKFLGEMNRRFQAYNYETKNLKKDLNKALHAAGGKKRDSKPKPVHDADRRLKSSIAAAALVLKADLDEIMAKYHLDGKDTSGAGNRQIEQTDSGEQQTLASVLHGRRLYIGNLSYDATAEHLATFFKGFAIESISLPKNPRNGHPVGHAFVDLFSPDEAARAVAELTGREFLERKVSVQHARVRGYNTGSQEMGQEGVRGKRKAVELTDPESKKGKVEESDVDDLLRPLMESLDK